MKSRLLLFLLVVAVAATAADALAQRPTAAPSKYQIFPAEPSEFGYVEPPHYLDHIKPAYEFLMAPLASWDWRAMNGVTPVKNQGAYGTCWAFAAHGDLESKVLIGESVIKDYSELNIQACNPVSTNCNYGGNAWMSTNYLALLGSVEESCDPYPGGCPNPTCVNPSCAFLKQVTEWKVIPNDVAAIKAALQTYGPVYTSMYASFSGFGSYDGSYCLTYTGGEDPNHAVLIVGFDDDMCGGNGAWIVKNSWGTGWGDNGYFYIQYGHARMGTNSNVITGYRDHDPNMTVHHWDEWGWWSSVGFGDGRDYAVVEIIPQASDQYLYSVHFWATSGPTTYTIQVFDDFNGSNMPTNSIAGPWTGTVGEAGYYTLDLATPVALSSGNAIYIYADLNTGSYAYPIPYDPSGPMETNKSFISNTGASFTALDNGGYAMGDIGLRATTGSEVANGDAEVIKDGNPVFHGSYVFPDHGVTWGSTIQVIAGEIWEDYLLGINHPMGTTCTETDTFCFSVTGTLAWPIVYTTGNHILESTAGNWYRWLDFTINVPCDVTVGDVNVVTFVHAYVDVEGNCRPEELSCSDNATHVQRGTLSFEVVESPPALYILQDTLYFVEQGQTAAYVPFAICNGDACADETLYGYLITSTGVVGPAISQGGTILVSGGECGDVYGIIDAGDAIVCDYDELTIIAWAGEEPEVVYDTCVQIIHVVEPVAVPMFTAPVVTILVLAMILAAAVILRRGAARKT